MRWTRKELETVVGNLIRFNFLWGLEEGSAATERTSGVTEPPIKDEHGWNGVWCGGHYANSCGHCLTHTVRQTAPYSHWNRHPWTYCNGDCKWSAPRRPWYGSRSIGPEHARMGACVPKFMRGVEKPLMTCLQAVWAVAGTRPTAAGPAPPAVRAPPGATASASGTTTATSVFPNATTRSCLNACFVPAQGLHPNHPSMNAFILGNMAWVHAQTNHPPTQPPTTHPPVWYRNAWLVHAQGPTHPSLVPVHGSHTWPVFTETNHSNMLY